MIEVRLVETKDDTELIEIIETEEGTEKPITKEYVCSEIRFDGYMYYVAYYKGEPCGYCAIGFLEFDNSILLRKILIKKNFPEHDVIVALINFVLEDHKDKGYQVIWLYFNHENRKKADTYKNLGFVCIENDFIHDEFKMAYKIQEVFQ